MIVHAIKEKYVHAVVDCCNEHGCNIRIDTGKDSVILKGERLVRARPEKMCDCLVFQNDKKIAIVELKRRSLGVDKIIDKFTNSGKKSIDMARSLEPGRFSLYMILLAKSYNHSAHEIIRKSRIWVDGKKHLIRTKKCGDSLKEIIR